MATSSRKGNGKAKGRGQLVVRGKATEFEPDTYQRQLVSFLAGMGVPRDKIRRFVLNPKTDQPVGVTTLTKYFKEELEDAGIIADAAVANALFRNATTGTQQFPAGNPTAQIFWLKTRMSRRFAENEPEKSKEISEEDALRRVAFLLEKMRHAAAEG